jgi:transcriptional regulator with XRE-family HTH domain
MTAPTTNPNPATQPDISQAKRQRFGQILSHYRERCHFSIQQLADLLEKPKSTVRFWLRGKRMPHRKELMILCARLDIDIEAFFGKEFVAEQFFERHLIGLHALQYRYLEVRQKDVFAALSLAVLGASVAFTYLLQAGLEVVLTSRWDFTCNMSFSRTGLESLILRVQPRGEEGLGFILTEGNAYPYLPWQPLTQSNLNALIQYLRGRVREWAQP